MLRPPQAVRRTPEAPLSRSQGIDSLPDELLSEIFRVVYSSRYYYIVPQEWCLLLGVCRRWLTVGRASAFLWCDIVITRKLNRSFITASLKYSKNALLTIEFHETVVRFAEILPLLSPHIHRIRSFKIYDGSETADDTALVTFLSYPFPSMETLEERSQPAQNPLIWQPDASSYPRLRNLTLEGPISIKVALTAVFPALRKLVLRYCNNPSFTFRSFTQFLSRHPYLEELKLFQYDLALDGPLANLTFPPTIRSFTLVSGSTSYMKDFLSSFTHISVHVSLYIARHYEAEETGIVPNSIISAAHMLPDRPGHYFHALSLVTAIEIKGRVEASWRFVGRALPGDADSLVVFEIYCPWWPDCFSAPRQLVDVVKIFSGAPVTDIRLTGNIVGEVPKAEWIVLFNAFPLLEHVAIEEVVLEHDEDVGDAREGLFEALLEHPPDGGPRWPRLRRFTLVCQDCTVLFTSLLPRALQVRAEQGAKVEQLRLFAERTPSELDEDEESEVMDELVPWFEEATWKKFVDDARLDLVLTYT